MKTFYVLWDGGHYLCGDGPPHSYSEYLGDAERFDALPEALDFIDSSGLSLDVLKVEISYAYSRDLFAENLPKMKNELTELEYWKQRCLMAEKFIDESPCDPDITPEQTKAYGDWQYFVNQENLPK